MADNENSNETWNMATSYLELLHQLSVRCIASQMNNDGMNWHKSLKALYMVIQCKLGNKSKVEAQNYYNRMSKHVVECKKNNMPINSLYLEQFELYLREQIEDMNLWTPKGDDPTLSYRNG